jgi:diaminohydroxyphosphoribosylaminopyrimidine deaminase/5-amino-6-(5-phosphoribosylamino)uracil reductase
MSNLESRISTPLRVVVDSTARTPPDSALLTADKRPPIIAVTENAPQERTDALQRAGAEVWVIPSSGERVDLTALMRRLGEGQVQSVLLEGGGTLAAAALAAGLVDRVYFLIAPLLIGGAEAPTALGGEGIARLADAWPITNVKTRRIGEDLLISGDIVRG